MTSIAPHQRVDAARVRAELSVQDLWLRYLALTGTADAFDIDGHLQGLIPLDPFQQMILEQAVNEALDDSYDAYRIPFDATPQVPNLEDQYLEDLIKDVLGHWDRSTQTKWTQGTAPQDGDTCP